MSLGLASRIRFRCPSFSYPRQSVKQIWKSVSNLNICHKYEILLQYHVLRSRWTPSTDKSQKWLWTRLFSSIDFTDKTPGLGSSVMRVSFNWWWIVGWQKKVALALGLPQTPQKSHQLYNVVPPELTVADVSICQNQTYKTLRLQRPLGGICMNCS